MIRSLFSRIAAVVSLAHTFSGQGFIFEDDTRRTTPVDRSRRCKTFFANRSAQRERYHSRILGGEEFNDQPNADATVADT